MIQINELVEKINEGLNANRQNVLFAIRSDTGDYMPPKRELNEVISYVNGVAQLTDSETIPIQGVKVVTQTLQLTFVVKLEDDAPSETFIEPVRKALEEYFTDDKIDVLTDEDGISFTVASYADIPTTGQIMLTAGPGLSVQFPFNVYYNFIENGVSSLSCKLLFDGELIPAMSATITRSPVMDSLPYSQTDGVSKGVTVSTAINVEFTAPTLKNAHPLFAAAYAYLKSGTPVVHTLTLEYENETESAEYAVTFGTVSLSTEGIKNAVNSITLIEAVEYGNT